jgi:hypothetical protein
MQLLVPLSQSFFFSLIEPTVFSIHIILYWFCAAVTKPWYMVLESPLIIQCYTLKVCAKLL